MRAANPRFVSHSHTGLVESSCPSTGLTLCVFGGSMGSTRKAFSFVMTLFTSLPGGLIVGTVNGMGARGLRLPDDARGRRLDQRRFQAWKNLSIHNRRRIGRLGRQALMRATAGSIAE